MTNQENLLILNDDLFLGEGRKRRTYSHPTDKYLCIKISSQRGLRSARREIGYFKRLHWYGKSFDKIADFKGTVETNFGKGDMYELIRDYNGEISKNLDYYFSLNDKYITSKILKSIEELRAYLIKEYILISDLALDNVLLKQGHQDSFKAIVIDGIGDNNQIPILEFMKPWGIKRNAKKWEIFKNNIALKYPDIAKNIKNFNDKL